MLALPDTTMMGKVCMVTGATSGLGAVTARELARLGAAVVIVGRSPERCGMALDHIREQIASPSVDYLVADLSSQQAIRELAAQFRSKYDRLDVLVNNAGAVFARRQESIDGIESTLAVNHLAYFLLTNLLLDVLKRSAPARIVNVSSVAHEKAELDFEDLQSRHGYRPFRAYARSKLANLLFTYELDRRLAGTSVTVNAVHPGLVRTGLGSRNGWLSRLGTALVHLRYRRFSVDPDDGARTIVFLAASPQVEGVSGKYFADLQPVLSSERSRDLDAGGTLWNVSAQMTGLPTA
jgi:NAD(P)-dependent dehydrogenase (short-subunit alcohol dehydrogenase family)